MRTPMMTAIAILATAVSFAAPAWADHPVPTGQACDPNYQGNMQGNNHDTHCRAQVSYNDKKHQWETEPFVYFDGTKVKKTYIVWSIVQPTAGPRWHFKDDSLRIPANADIRGFTNACATDTEDSCPGDEMMHDMFQWYVDNPKGAGFEYELKLYADGEKRAPVLVKARVTKLQKGTFVDPIIVIQGTF